MSLNDDIRALTEDLQDDPVTTDDPVDDAGSNDASGNDSVNSADIGDTGDSVDIDDTGDDSGRAAEDNEEEIQTIAQLSDAIGWDAEDLYAMKVGMGEGEDAIPLGKLKDTYREVLKERKNLATQLAEQKVLTDSARSGVQQQQHVSQEMQAAQANLVSIQQQYASHNWMEAEAEDPGAAALLRQKFQEAFNSAQSGVANVENQMQQQQVQQLQQAAVKMQQLIPEWSDKDTMTAGQRAVTDLLRGAGYQDDMINAISDPIAVSLMNELVQLRAEKKGATAALQKARVSPKVLKAGGKRVSKVSNADGLAKKARQSGDKHDAVAAVRALLT